MLGSSTVCPAKLASGPTGNRSLRTPMTATDLRPSPPRAARPRGLHRPLLAHLPFAVLLLAGAVLRLMTWGAYRPALLFPDSRIYLLGAANEQLMATRPGGYSAFLWPFLHLHLGGLPSITLVQHLLGLAMAAAIYLLLLRLRVWPWLAALATAPLLLDSMQLSLEQYVMSDVLFEALLLGACLLLLWRRRPGAPLLLAAPGSASPSRSPPTWSPSTSSMGRSP